MALSIATICSDSFKDFKDSIPFCVSIGGILTMLTGNSIVDDNKNKIRDFKRENSEKIEA